MASEITKLHSGQKNFKSKNIHIMKQYSPILLTCILLLFLSSCGSKWSETDKGDYKLVENKGG